jgi:hypothetical protein
VKWCFCVTALYIPCVIYKSTHHCLELIISLAWIYLKDTTLSWFVCTTTAQIFLSAWKLYFIQILFKFGFRENSQLCFSYSIKLKVKSFLLLFLMCSPLKVTTSLSYRIWVRVENLVKYWMFTGTICMWTGFGEGPNGSFFLPSLSTKSALRGITVIQFVTCKSAHFKI